MFEKVIHNKIHFYLSLLIAFFLPVGFLLPILIVLLLLNWIIEGDFKNKFSLLSKNKAALTFILFYLIFIPGLIYTQNFKSGFFDLQVKLSLLVFPLLFASKPLDPNQKKSLSKTFVCGLVAACIFLLIRAFYLYLFKGVEKFFYLEFSIFLHPSYLSMYINLGLIFLLYNRKESLLQRKYLVLIVLIFSVVNILLSSKLGIITMFVIYFVYLCNYIFKEKKYLLGITGFLIIVGGIYLIVNFVPEISGRLERAIAAVSSDNVDVKTSESTAARINVWRAAKEVIVRNPLIGVGTGDVKDELMNEYLNLGMTGAYEHKLNAHNQFIQTLVALGVIGFLFFLSSFIFPFIQAIKNQNVLYLFFIILIAANFLVESMLETQAGVIFYAFFNSLLFFRKED